MTIAVLRSLHAIIGDAIDDIERIYSSHHIPEDSGPSSNGTVSDPPTISQDFTSKTTPRPEPKPLILLPNSQAYASPPPSPSIATTPGDVSSTPAIPAFPAEALPVDFPSLDSPCDPTSLSETLTTHPTVLDAIGRIVAAAGQLSATIQVPFLTLCDAIMGYHLQSCMRLFEASHVAEILREAGPAGLHVDAISRKNRVQATKLAHVLRLLAAHHILREVSPDVFTLNRISSMVDSGKKFSELKAYQEQGIPEAKYSETGGIAAFVGLCTDEIHKSSAYMTETYYLSPSPGTREGKDPARAPFCFAFNTLKSRTAFFGWLEGEADGKDAFTDGGDRIESGPGGSFHPTLEPRQAYNQDVEDRLTPAPTRSALRASRMRKTSSSPASSSSTDSDSRSTVTSASIRSNEPESKFNSNKFRLERFGKAMSGSEGWEAPGAILNGFDWQSLPRGSVIVDVGGGIGSTSMLLASAYSSDSCEDNRGLRFIIQDRPVVCEMGEKAWQAKCPELLESGTARFQVHDFFTPQPVRDASVFLLRCVLHDWPNGSARQILLRLREAATSQTKLVIADFILPLACPEDLSSRACFEGVEGAETALPPAPLLPNLGKANANVYWMDLTMQVMFNSQERTLREMIDLTSSAGWKIVKVTKTPGSSLGYLIAVPVAIPSDVQELEEKTAPMAGNLGENSRKLIPKEDLSDPVSNKGICQERRYREDMEMLERASSRCGTPTFGSHTRLSSVQEALSRFGGGIVRSKAMGRSSSTPSSSLGAPKPLAPPIALKPALSLAVGKKKKPSPLSVPPLYSSSSPLHSPSPPFKIGSASPRNIEPLRSQVLQTQKQSLSPVPKVVPRRKSFANLRSSQPPSTADAPPLPTLAVSSLSRQPPPSPMSPVYPETPVLAVPRTPIRRRASHAQLGPHFNSATVGPVPPMPSMIPVPIAPIVESPPKTGRRTLGSPSMNDQLRYQRTSNTLHVPNHILTRKRSGTVAGNSNLSGIERSSGFTGLRGHGRQMSVSSEMSSSVRSRSPAIGSVSVLAAAARIEKGQLSRPFSP